MMNTNVRYTTTADFLLKILSSTGIDAKKQFSPRALCCDHFHDERSAHNSNPAQEDYNQGSWHAIKENDMQQTLLLQHTRNTHTHLTPGALCRRRGAQSLARTGNDEQSVRFQTFRAYIAHSVHLSLSSERCTKRQHHVLGVLYSVRSPVL
jgi:hypothetical protein